MPTRILIADRRWAARAGLRDMLARQRGFRVVGETATESRTLSLMKARRPDVLILDPTLDGGNSCAASAWGQPSSAWGQPLN